MHKHPRTAAPPGTGTESKFFVNFATAAAVGTERPAGATNLGTSQ